MSRGHDRGLASFTHGFRVTNVCHPKNMRVHAHFGSLQFTDRLELARNKLFTIG